MTRREGVIGLGEIYRFFFTKFGWFFNLYFIAATIAVIWKILQLSSEHQLPWLLTAALLVFFLAVPLVGFPVGVFFLYDHRRPQSTRR